MTTSFLLSLVHMWGSEAVYRQVNCLPVAYVPVTPVILMTDQFLSWRGSHTCSACCPYVSVDVHTFPLAPTTREHGFI